MTEPTREDSSTELCREQFKALLNLFYVPTAFANAILYSRSEIMHEFGSKLWEYQIFGRENISVSVLSASDRNVQLTVTDTVLLQTIQSIVINNLLTIKVEAYMLCFSNIINELKRAE